MERLAGFLVQGGVVLWTILLASLLLWILIFERYWFFWFQALEGVCRRLE